MLVRLQQSFRSNLSSFFKTGTLSRPSPLISVLYKFRTSRVAEHLARSCSRPVLVRLRQKLMANFFSFRTVTLSRPSPLIQVWSRFRSSRVAEHLARSCSRHVLVRLRQPCRSNFFSFRTGTLSRPSPLIQVPLRFRSSRVAEHLQRSCSRPVLVRSDHPRFNFTGLRYKFFIARISSSLLVASAAN